MAYPEKLLADDEQVVEHLHPHWITLVPATFWFIVLCAAAGAGLAYAPDKGTKQTVVVIIIVVVWAVLVSWLAVRAVHHLAHLALHLHHAPRADPARRAQARRSRHRPAAHLRCWVRADAVGSHVRAGTLTIESASEHGQETLTNVPHSAQQQQLLNRLIEQDGERRARNVYGGQPGFPPPQQPPAQGQPPQQGYPPQQPGGYQQTTPQPPYPPQ